jgi:hypothetical protein
MRRIRIETAIVQCTPQVTYQKGHGSLYIVPSGNLFDTNVENGGEGFLIGLHRCGNFEVPLRDVRYSSKDPETGGRITFAGNDIKHKKGGPYLVDCNVTGMNVGTTTTPCFPLRYLWEHSLFPAIKAMLAPNG